MNNERPLFAIVVYLIVSYADEDVSLFLTFDFMRPRKRISGGFFKAQLQLCLLGRYQRTKSKSANLFFAVTSISILHMFSAFSHVKESLVFVLL